ADLPNVAPVNIRLGDPGLFGQPVNQNPKVRIRIEAPLLPVFLDLHVVDLAGFQAVQCPPCVLGLDAEPVPGTVHRP
ncbi:hypothetical protein LWS67_25970, partial [Bacillus atrophaeus]|uniref:hypothetical protein n=1 Tax=Bacillus atrophaeus TaxID=1452 RepID=UPI001EFC18DA